MPVVSREKYNLHDEEAKKRGWHYTRGGFIKVTKYTSKTKNFTIELPDYMQGVLDKKQVSGKSQDEVDAAFRKVVAEYGLRILSKRKVILYSLLANVDEEIDGKRFQMDNLGQYGSVGENSTGMALWFQVCWETKDDTRFKYYNLDGYSVGKPSYRSHWDVMEYTPEREKFFEELSHRIAIMVYNANSFLRQKKKLIDLIDHSRALPFFPTTETEDENIES